MFLPSAVEEALARGYNVLPFRLNRACYLKSWKQYQTQRVTEGLATGWQRLWHPKYWAVVTGIVSGIVVFDFDVPEGPDFMRKLGLDPHVRTPSSGYHVYFRHPRWRVPGLTSYHRKKQGDPYPGLDVRGDGNIAKLWGESAGGTYLQLRPLAPEPLDSLPQAMRERLGLARPPAPPLVTVRPPFLGPRKPIARPSLEKLILNTVSKFHGKNRNEAGFHLACQLRDNGYSDCEAYAVGPYFIACLPESNAKGRWDPYTLAEFQASVKQAYSRPAREPWNRRHAKGS
jgi:hypothetical protein